MQPSTNRSTGKAENGAYQIHDKRNIFIILSVALVSRFALTLFRLVFGFSTNFNLELYNDFNGYYVQWLNYLHQGYIPYKDFAYTYPPGFLFFLYPFYIAGIPMFAIVLLDAITALVVYKIMRFVNPKISFYAALVYAILPTSLLYEGYVWFSTQPFLFFALTSIYFTILNRVYLSGIFLGISFLIKQEALILLLPLFLYFVYEKKWAGIKTTVLCSFLVFALGSLPFFIAFPSYYVYSITLSKFGSAPSSYLISSGLVQNITWKVTNITVSYTPICTSLAPNTSICVNNGITYTQIYSPSPVLNMLMHYLLIPYGLATAIVAILMKLRGRIGIFALSVAALNLLFCIIFFYYIVYPYRYYFIPLYLLLILGSARKIQLLSLVTFSAVSLILPSGLIQPVIFSIYVMLHVSLFDAKNVKILH